MSTLGTQADIAGHLDLSTRRVRDLAHAGAIPRPERKSAWNLDDCRVAYIKHLRSVAGGLKDESGKFDLTKERARLAAEQADAAAMKNAQARKELVLVEDVVKVVGDEYAAVRAKLLGMPAKLAPMVAAAKSKAEAQQIIDAEVRETLSELAYAGDPGAESGSGKSPAKGKANKPKAAAKTKRKPVGRPKPKAKPNKRGARPVENKPG